MLHIIALPAVQAWAGLCQSGEDDWIPRGLELFLLLRVLRQAGIGDLWLRLLWRQRDPLAFGKAQAADLSMFAWLQHSISDSELDEFLRQAIARGREAPITLKDLEQLLTQWPSAEWCLVDFRARLDEVSSAKLKEVEQVARAWENIIPSEVVGGSEAKLSKLIIRTAIHVKVKWSTLQKLLFLDLLGHGGIYRESLIHVGNAYGFDLSVNMEVLAAWCLLLVKHNCQDHVGVLKRFLQHQGEMDRTVALFNALAASGKVETRWKFLAQELWETCQPQLSPVVQHQVFQVLHAGKCIGRF
ncbi:unnamed protein product [Effrenium voratum]|uniref:Peptidase M1 leukotriene A4 hydrolase/aminopeptidase C-terminal domain-containing protein n=1 Tax=Effrenium voratum TaxID=2562239 RepID=A0AA36N2X4_9DINO|nr:unnamed protein product [Effrenium voratum]